jgi:hypothetical protein
MPLSFPRRHPDSFLARATCALSLFVSLPVQAQETQRVGHAAQEAPRGAPVGFAPRFLAACANPFLASHKRKTVEAIASWANRVSGARGCAAAARVLATASTIELEDAGLTWAAPLGEARNAQRIYVAGNAFGSLDELAGLAVLEVLDLRGSPVERLPGALLARLRVLNISGTRVDSLLGLSAARGLVQLDAHGVGLRDLSGVDAFPALVSLGVTANALQDLAGLEALRELRFLYVAYNRLTDLSPAWTLPALRLLNAKGNPIAPDVACPMGVECVLD